jgi:hypothetical protein
MEVTKMLNYTQDIIEFYNANSTAIEGLSIEETRDSLIERRGLSKIKAIGVVKTVSQSVYCKQDGDSKYFITFLLKSEGKRFKFIIDGVEQSYTHLMIEKR